MRKRAALSLEMVVVAALLLVVLIVIAVIFRTQITNYAKGYTNIADDSIAQAKGEKCQTILGDRYCASKCEGDDQPVGDFPDCEGKKCCERI